MPNHYKMIHLGFYSTEGDFLCYEKRQSMWHRDILVWEHNKCSVLQLPKFLIFPETLNAAAYKAYLWKLSCWHNCPVLYLGQDCAYWHGPEREAICELHQCNASLGKCGDSDIPLNHIFSSASSLLRGNSNLLLEISIALQWCSCSGRAWKKDFKLHPVPILPYLPSAHLFQRRDN